MAWNCWRVMVGTEGGWEERDEGRREGERKEGGRVERGRGREG